MGGGVDPRWASPRPYASTPGRYTNGNVTRATHSSPNGSPDMQNRLTPPTQAGSTYCLVGGSGSVSPEYRALQEQLMRNVRTAGGCVPFLPKPTAKRVAYQLRQQQAHGARVRGIAHARRLWARLEENDSV